MRIPSRSLSSGVLVGKNNVILILLPNDKEACQEVALKKDSYRARKGAITKKSVSLNGSPKGALNCGRGEKEKFGSTFYRFYGLTHCK